LIADKLFEGIRLVATNMFMVLVNVKMGHARAIRFLGLFSLALPHDNNNLKNLIISCGAILNGQPKSLCLMLEKEDFWVSESLLAIPKYIKSETEGPEHLRDQAKTLMFLIESL